MRDLQAIFWLRWRQFRDGAIYWLRVLGYQPGEKSFSQQIYVLYLAGIGLLWFGTVWTWAFDQANLIGSFMPLMNLAGLLVVIPVIGLLAQVWVFQNALRSTPLKLSFADMAYVAGAPISPSAPVLVGFFRQVLLRLLIISLGSALLSVLLIRPIGNHLGTVAVFRALVAIFPFVLLTWAIGWLMGILRLIDRRIGRTPYLWVLPVLLIPLAYFLPDVVLWPGRAFILHIYDLLPVWVLPFVLLLATLFIVFLARWSQRINMVQATDESIVYARIQALGLLAWRQPNLQLRIRMQTASASRKPWFKLPKARGLWMLVTRAGLSYVRHPWMLLSSLVWGVLMTHVAVLTIVNQFPPQIWIGWLLFASIVPPQGMLHVFQVDLEERFLRQFLPVNGFQLFIADVVLPLIVLILGALFTWSVEGFSPEITLIGFLVIPVLGILLALCGAVALTYKRVLQTRLLATGASFGAVIVAGLGLGLLPAVGVALFAALILSGLVEQNA
jgi:hypothetical protein